ncbi:MAG TPA: acyltransferase [Parvibaculum sp.]
MRFRVLDSWRGILAVLVSLGHIEVLWPFVNAPLIRNSYLAVDFFFVLSGFVIAHAYGARVGDGASATGFMVRRFGRLWPLHACVIGFFLVLNLVYLVLSHHGVWTPEAPFWGGFSAATLPTNLTLLQATGLHEGGTWNFPSWSICVEFWTYLVFALACLAFGDRLGRMALPIALTGGLVVALFSKDYMSVYEGLSLFRCIYGFFTGVAIHALLTAKGLPGRRLAARAEIPMVALAVVFIALAGKSASTMLAPAVFGALIYVFAAEAGPVSRALSSKPFLKLGAWSYSIYMVHVFVLFLMKDAAHVTERLTGLDLTRMARFGDGDRELIFIHDRWTSCLVVLTFVGLSVALAALTYRLVEEPGRKFFNDVARKLAEAEKKEARAMSAPRLLAGNV